MLWSICVHSYPVHVYFSRLWPLSLPTQSRPPEMKRASHIFTSEEFDMERCVVWSCFFSCLFPSQLRSHIAKNGLHQQTKKGSFIWHIEFLRVRVFTCNTTRSSQGFFYLPQVRGDKPWCLWKPRAFHNDALLNVVTAFQSPWQHTGSVTEPFVAAESYFRLS